MRINALGDITRLYGTQINRIILMKVPRTSAPSYHALRGTRVSTVRDHTDTKVITLPANPYGHFKEMLSDKRVYVSNIVAGNFTVASTMDHVVHIKCAQKCM